MAPLFATGAFVSCLLWSAVLCQSNICYEKADILFVMDSSGSIGAEDFQKQLRFAATFVNNFQVGTAQFSLLRFDTTAEIDFDFNDYRDSTSLKNAILSVKYPGLGTDTAFALKLAREEAFLPTRGARRGTPKIVIVLTDGQSNNPNATAIEAEKLKHSNVLVLAIGISTLVNKEELYTIATYPEDVFEVPNYNQLVSIVYDYSEMVCREVKLFNCNNKVDVFFLLDSSSKVTQDQYQNALLYASNVTARFELANAHFGAATFGGSTVQKLFNIGQMENQFQLSQALLTGVYLNGYTDINNALKSIVTLNVFDPASGGRADATKVLVILTNGGSISASQAKLTATELRATGINIITVGVSNPNITELKDLVNHIVLDVVATMSNPKVPVDRIEELTASQECKLPTGPARDVSDYCRQNNLVNGIHSHPYDCTKFIECTFLRTSIMNCTHPLVYDPAVQTCNYPGFAPDCTDFNNPFKTPPPVIAIPSPTTPKPCITGLLDILFIIDGSENVGSQVFRDELGFAANLAENFHLGANGMLFATTTFGTNVQNLFGFNDYTEYKPLQMAILNGTFFGGSTNTFLALENAVNFISTAHGSRDSAPKVAVVFTNGRSSDSARTLQAATALKGAGVHIISVGLSNPDLKELQAIASTPSEAFVNDFYGVLRALRIYSNSTCAETIVCRGIQFADVVFVLDSSNSISDKDYRGQLSFVADVTSRFTLGPNDTRFGAVIFSQETVKLFDLKDFTSTDRLQSAILSASHLKSGTDTALALNFVREQQMFSISNGARENSTKILVILTDGRSNSINDTVAAALRLKSSGVKFIAVGIGDEIYPEELKELASGADNLFLVSGFDALHQINESVTTRICYSSKEPENVPDYSTLCAAYRWIDGQHPNPNDCSTYVQCYAFTTTVIACAAGLAYDPVIQKCTDKAAAHPCNDPNYYGPSVTSPPSIVESTIGPIIVDVSNICAQYHLTDGMYPHPGSCPQFLECTAEITSVLTCPEGLHFNTGKGVCDDVHEVDCQVNYHFFDHL